MTAASPIRGGGPEAPDGHRSGQPRNLWVANSGVVDLPCPSAMPDLGGGSTARSRCSAPTACRRQSGAFRGGGLTIPWGIAVDGNDNVWVANFDGQRLSEFCGLKAQALPAPGASPEHRSRLPAGYGFDGLVRDTGVAIDPSGNVWLANNWKTVPLPSNPGGYEIVAFVGLGGPLEDPIDRPPRATLSGRPYSRVDEVQARRRPSSRRSGPRAGRRGRRRRRRFPPRSGPWRCSPRAARRCRPSRPWCGS